MDTTKTQEDFSNLITREDVANLLEIPDKSLRYFLYKVKPDNMYTTFKVLKADGTPRIISAPNNELKHIQRKLACILSNMYVPKVCAYGFISDKTILMNAQQHTKKQIVFNIDLKDFFTQIHFGRIRGMLIKKPYNIGEEAATVIAQIATFNKCLPQGAPSSPIITNMICVPLDNALLRLAKKTGCVYTRYADDITFSTYKKEFDRSIVYEENGVIFIGKELTNILQKHSFDVNLNKIALRRSTLRQEVTGLTVNKFPNVRRSYIKHIRAILHSCEKFGVISAAKLYINKGFCKNNKIRLMANDDNSNDEIVAWFKSVLKGKISYIRQIKGDKNLTYLSYASKMNAIFNETVFDLTELNRFDSIIKNSVLICECAKSNHQGSAFFIRGYGLFTCYHVTENNNFFKVYRVDSYHHDHVGMIGNALNLLSSDYNIDYALYTSEKDFCVDPTLTFELGNSKTLSIGDQVTIIGYPEHQEGSSYYAQTCNITSKKYYMGALFYTVSGRIVHGASGGIVLNSDQEIVGIIKGGMVTLDEDELCIDQGFVPIHLAIEHLMQQTKIKNEHKG